MTLKRRHLGCHTSRILVIEGMFTGAKSVENLCQDPITSISMRRCGSGEGRDALTRGRMTRCVQRTRDGGPALWAKGDACGQHGGCLERTIRS